MDMALGESSQGNNYRKESRWAWNHDGTAALPNWNRPGDCEKRGGDERGGMSLSPPGLLIGGQFSLLPFFPFSFPWRPRCRARLHSAAPPATHLPETAVHCPLSRGRCLDLDSADTASRPTKWPGGFHGEALWGDPLSHAVDRGAGHTITTTTTPTTPPRHSHCHPSSGSFRLLPFPARQVIRSHRDDSARLPRRRHLFGCRPPRQRLACRPLPRNHAPTACRRC